MVALQLEVARLLSYMESQQKDKRKKNFNSVITPLKELYYKDIPKLISLNNEQRWDDAKKDAFKHLEDVSENLSNHISNGDEDNGIWSRIKELYNRIVHFFRNEQEHENVPEHENAPVGFWAGFFNLTKSDMQVQLCQFDDIKENAEGVLEEISPAIGA